MYSKNRLQYWRNRIFVLILLLHDQTCKYANYINFSTIGHETSRLTIASIGNRLRSGVKLSWQHPSWKRARQRTKQLQMKSTIRRGSTQSINSVETKHRRLWSCKVSNMVRWMKRYETWFRKPQYDCTVLNDFLVKIRALKRELQGRLNRG